jgi:hypothetical protein
MTAPAKLYAVEVDYCGRRRLTTPRYATLAKARQALDRHAPLFRARIVTVRGERARQAAYVPTPEAVTP